MVVGRVIWASSQELELGQEAFEQGDRESAVIHLRRSAHWYVPGNPYVGEALRELRQIGRQAEMEGQIPLALMAYRAIRTSCLGTRGLTVPHRQQFEAANGRIAALMARQDPAPMDRTSSLAQRRRQYNEQLERLDQPDPLWSLLAGIAFLAWIGAGFGFFLRGLDRELHLQPRPALRWAAAFVASFILWVVALLLA